MPTELRTDERLRAPRLLLAPAQTLLDDGPRADWAVQVADGRFADIGPRDDLRRRHPDLHAIELPDTLLMPGFVDTHHHLTQSFGKALAFGEPSEIFQRIWVPLERHLDEHALYLSAKLAALEALRGGFTTVCDAGTRAAGGLDAIAAAAAETGIRCVLALTCNDGGDEARWLAQRADAERHLARHWDGALHASLAISLPEVGSDRALHETSALCAEAGVVFQVHVNEHLASIERSLVERGLRPLEHLDRAAALGPQALLAHATMLTPHEIVRLRDTGSAVAYNPVASAWKGNAVAQANLLATLGVRLGLGTDGTRSDGFRLMDAAETAQRLTSGLASGDSSCGGGWRWLDMATTGGADAAGLGRVTGRIAPGLAADFLLIDLAVPELTPSWDLTWELVRLVGRDQLRAVFVDGQLRLADGWPVDWDGRALLREARRVAQEAVAKAPIQRIHATADAHRRALRGSATA
jgi:5-methylthioadenosine/S-adenosylhomocysteine deaminase